MAIHAIPIITPRLILRPPTLGDAAAMQAAKEEIWPELQAWMAWSYDDQKPLAPLVEHIKSSADWQTRRSLSLIGLDRRTGRFVIGTGLDETEEGANEYGTGYWVAREYQGQGLATEAANAVIRYAFGHLDAGAIRISHHEGNEGSRRIIEKLGFSPAGVGEIRRCSNDERLKSYKYIMTNPAVLPPLTVGWREKA